MGSDAQRDRRYEFELRLEELCVEWAGIGIDTSSIRAGIDEHRDPIGTAEHLVRTGAAGFDSARSKLGIEKTIEALVSDFPDVVSADVVELAQDRISSGEGA
jgi:hypothetical protein